MGKNYERYQNNSELKFAFLMLFKYSQYYVVAVINAYLAEFLTALIQAS
ncbi:hypothetical protein [Psychrobacter sp. I-STPA6b]|nr:hypothetical protein [Psychrobacter sp. I-STPA6b]